MSAAIPQHMRDAAIADYVAGYAIEAAARRNDVSPKSLQRWLKAAGVTRAPGPAHRPEVQQRAVELYKDGMTIRQVASELRIAYSKVSQYVREAGVEIKAAGRSEDPIPFRGQWERRGLIWHPVGVERRSRRGSVLSVDVPKMCDNSRVRNGPGNAVVAHRPGPHPTLVRSAEL